MPRDLGVEWAARTCSGARDHLLEGHAISSTAAFTDDDDGHSPEYRLATRSESSAILMNDGEPVHTATTQSPLGVR